MAKITYCRGCPASGKTTWAKTQKGTRINRDDIRRDLFKFGQWNEYKFTSAKENQVTEIQDSMLKKAAAKGVDVIDDNTNLNPKYFDKSVEQAKSLGFQVEIKDFFDVHLHQLLERNLHREFSVHEDVVHRMFRAQLEIQGRVINPTPGLSECIIIDVDGTIADMGKGESWGRQPFDWHKVGHDRPRVNVCRFIKHIVGDRLTSRNAPVPIFVSGRDGVCYDETREWIYQHIFPGYVSRDSVLLYMRDKDDMRADCEIKEELLRKHVLPTYNVSYCVDDRNQMTYHWRALGLECWQVAAGRF